MSADMALRMPLLIVGDPRRIALDLKTSVTTSLMSRREILKSFTVTLSSACLIPRAMCSASILVPSHIVS